MKLVFPGGEHPQVLLGPGVNRVGSDPQANIVLDKPGVLPQHCQLHVSATGVMLEVPHGTTVSVNGRHVDGLIALRPGDSVTFDHVLARLASLDAVGSPRGRTAALAGFPRAANDDPGVTAVRQVMPMYVLRGVTGGAFGRSYPVQGPLTIGRSPECDIRINDPGLSRVHARLVPTRGRRADRGSGFHQRQLPQRSPRDAREGARSATRSASTSCASAWSAPVGTSRYISRPTKAVRPRRAAATGYGAGSWCAVAAAVATIVLQ